MGNLGLATLHTHNQVNHREGNCAFFTLHPRVGVVVSRSWGERNRLNTQVFEAHNITQRDAFPTKYLNSTISKETSVSSLGPTWGR